MLKRLSPFALISLSQANPVSIANSITIEANSFSGAWGCAKCLRNEFTYIIPGAKVRGQVSDNTAYDGACCLSSTDSTFCSQFFITGIIVRDSVVLEFVSGSNSLEVQTAQCQYNTAVCSSSGGNGPDSSQQSLVIDKIGSSEVSLTMSGAFVANLDQCSWVVKVKCGAPGLKIDTTTTMDESSAILSFTDYSNQFNVVDGNTLEGTAPHNVWLNKDLKTAYYDMTTPNGVPGMLKFEILIPDSITNYWNEVPGWIIEQWHTYTL